MIRDARRIPAGSVIGCDVCIVGGGAAGITLAREMAGGPWRVVLLESGDLEISDAEQAPSIVSVGATYKELPGSRVRALGGTTSIWGGWIRPLDDCDFQPRDWIPGSGWPFGAASLRNVYERAHALCGVEAREYTEAELDDGVTPSGTGKALSLLDQVAFQIAPTRFGEVHGAMLKRAPHIDVILQATALDLDTAPDGVTVRGVRAATVARNRFVVEARLIVLAAGALENARLLLASKAPAPGGLGNAHDLVGRYFADHLHVPIGTLYPVSPAFASRFGVRRVHGAARRIGFSLSAAARRAHRLPGSAVTLHNADDPHDLLSPGSRTGSYHSLAHIVRALRRGRKPVAPLRDLASALHNFDAALVLAYRKLRPPPWKRLTIGIRAEQVPNPDSRVVLDDSVDQFGMRRVRVEWRVSDRDLDSMAVAQDLFARSLTSLASRLEMWSRDGTNGWRERIAPGAHHMGTTRMNADPCSGVVDEHCRVHGTTNVFVAGSSVFPTGGWAPPTLTIIALAIRLADYLKLRVR